MLLNERFIVIPEIIKDAETKMAAAVDHAREEFGAIRTGRAHPAMFNKIMVDYYGSMTPLQQLASFHVPEARTILITPYDRGAMAGIEKAIRDSDLGVNPANDGQLLRLVLPALTEDRRKEYTKLARSKAEEGRISVRNVRRHAKEQIDKLLKDKEVGEDEVARADKQMETVTKKYVDQIDDLLKAKEAELLEV